MILNMVTYLFNNDLPDWHFDSFRFNLLSNKRQMNKVYVYIKTLTVKNCSRKVFLIFHSDASDQQKYIAALKYPNLFKNG